MEKQKEIDLAELYRAFDPYEAEQKWRDIRNGGVDTKEVQSEPLFRLTHTVELPHRSYAHPLSQKSCPYRKYPGFDDIESYPKGHNRFNS